MSYLRDPERFASLDALRGVAALVVLSFQCWRIGLLGDLDVWQWHLLTWTPLNLLVSGRPWVIFFLIISGFVLPCSLERAVTFDYRGFLTRRVCRVYLPYVVSILLSLLLCEIIRPAAIPDIGRWFNAVGWGRDPTAGVLLDHLLVTGVEGEDLLNPVVWSLVYELRISIVFPILFILAFRWPVSGLGLALGAFVGIGLMIGCSDLQCRPFHCAALNESLMLKTYFTLFFVIGIVLERFRNPVRRRLLVLAPLTTAAIGLGAVYAMIILGIPQLMRFVPADISFAVGAATMIAAAISGGRLQRTLETPTLGWRGRASYSLHLTHYIVLLAVVHVLYGQGGVMPLLFGVVAASLLVAWICWWLVEAPCHRLGQRLGSRIDVPSMLPGRA